jgi:hypothetical protein
LGKPTTRKKVTAQPVTPEEAQQQAPVLGRGREGRGREERRGKEEKGKRRGKEGRKKRKEEREEGNRGLPQFPAQEQF